MKADADRRKHEAGLMLTEACEQVLGVRGPTALAALTGRSKSWWSKLTSGAAPFPTWEDLEELLPAGLTMDERDSLHLRYRRAWLGLYDPEMLEWFDSPLATRLSLVDLWALNGTAYALGYGHGDYRNAVRLLRILENCLTARGIELLSRQEQRILWGSMDQQSTFERGMGNYGAAITAAQRSINYQRSMGNQAGELLARHTLGRAQQGAGRVVSALNQFESLHREFKRIGMTSEAVDAKRDFGITKLGMARVEEGEAELLQAWEVRKQSADSRYRTGLWLAQASLQQEKIEDARRWLARTRVIARRHPDEMAKVMELRYVAEFVERLEQGIAGPQPASRG